MHKYCIVNNFTGEDLFIEADDDSIEESRWFWSLLGWSVFKLEGSFK